MSFENSPQFNSKQLLTNLSVISGIDSIIAWYRYHFHTFFLKEILRSDPSERSSTKPPPLSMFFFWVSLNPLLTEGDTLPDPLSTPPPGQWKWSKDYNRVDL